jgi:hypothetical protein
MAVSKNKLIILLLSWCTVVMPQQLRVSLHNAGSIKYRQQYYLFGLQPGSPGTVFKVYKASSSLIITDSLLLDAKNVDPARYLKCYADTLHDYLNIYLQEQSGNNVTIMRINSQPALLKKIENVDVARLNNVSMFGGEKLYFRNRVYAIATTRDSSGRQFYLNCYQLKSADENFDYTRKWQFPFEKKNILSARLIHADGQLVLAFVNLQQTDRITQWLLTINARTGQMVKGIRLNSKTGNDVYQYGDCIVDTAAKSVLVAGTRQYENKQNPAQNPGYDPVRIFLAQTDSFGQVIHKDEFQLPVTHQQTGLSKVRSRYMVKISDLKRTPSGLTCEAEILRTVLNEQCFQYVNSAHLQFNRIGDSFEMVKQTTGNFNMVEDYYFTPDRNDLNGKLCRGESSEPDELYFKRPVLPVKLIFRHTEGLSPSFLLTRSSSKKKNITYSVLAPEGKAYKMRTVTEIPWDENPAVISSSEKTFYIGKQLPEGGFELKMFSW